jgi:ribosome-associated heat shock protein Hsp15
MSLKAGKGSVRDEGAWQRLDLWLWCARAAKARSDCALLVEGGAVRLNRQPVVKPHAKLRIGDVLTMAWRGEVRVWRVLALATRRGPAPEARLLYQEVPEARLLYQEVPEARLLYQEVPEQGGERESPDPCAESRRAAYRGAPEVRPDSADPEDHHQEL